jgi:hypothetical protein
MKSGQEILVQNENSREDFSQKREKSMSKHNAANAKIIAQILAA